MRKLHLTKVNNKFDDVALYYYKECGKHHFNIFLRVLIISFLLTK